MKVAKQKSKQSVWLLTMLTVMIVLSAYYLVSEPLVYTDLVNGTNEDTSLDTNNSENLSIFDIEGVTDDLVIEESSVDEITKYNEYIDEITVDSNDAIVALKMEKVIAGASK